MTFNKRRAFHVGGASWLFLCAVGHGAMAQGAATPRLLDATAGNHRDGAKPDRAAERDPVANAGARRPRRARPQSRTR